MRKLLAVLSLLAVGALGVLLTPLDATPVALCPHVHTLYVHQTDHWQTQRRTLAYTTDLDTIPGCRE